MAEHSLHPSRLHNWFRRIHNGDRVAADELFRATGKRLERLARHMLRHFPNVRRCADTGDVFQESVVRLLHCLRHLDEPPANVRDFLSLAATHIRRVLLDLARRYAAEKRRGDFPLLSDEDGQQFGRSVSTEEEPEELDQWQRFHEEVEALPVEEREVISLRFYHGWSEAEMAELFGVTERTVRRRWASGCARLCLALKGQPPAC